MKRALILALIATSFAAEAKVFKNSYIEFEVPDDWTCAQEGVAWTCNPKANPQSKEAVIVLAAKVAGPEDNVATFSNFLKQPKRILTKVGTAMPSQVMYAQERLIGTQKWVQAQHLSSEIQDYYTLYLATVKDKLAMLVSFSAEKTHYTKYNPVFDKAIRSIKIIANQEKLFPKTPIAGSQAFGIQGAGDGTVAAQLRPEDLLPPPEKKRGVSTANLGIVILVLLILAGAGVYIYQSKRKKISHGKSAKPRTK